MDNIFELERRYLEIIGRKEGDLTEEDKLIVRSLLATNYSLEQTMFITDADINLIKKLYSIINGKEVEEEDKRVDILAYRDYVVEQLTAANPGFTVLSKKYGDIEAEFNGENILVKTRASRNYKDPQEPVVSSWNKIFPAKSLTDTDYYAFGIETDSGYKSVLMSVDEMKTLLKKKGISASTTETFIAFEFDNSNTVTEIRQKPYVDASSYEADTVKQWKL